MFSQPATLKRWVLYISVLWFNFGFGSHFVLLKILSLVVHLFLYLLESVCHDTCVEVRGQLLRVISAPWHYVGLGDKLMSSDYKSLYLLRHLTSQILSL